MAEKDRASMPMSTAGLVRYFESEKEVIKLKPVHIVGICVGLIALELFLRFAIV